MTPDFWKGKTVLITGHTGFKGAWLSLWLQQLGAKVIGYSLAPTSEPNLFTLTNLKELIISLHGDVRDLTQLTNVIAEYKPVIIFHMAAQALVRTSYEAPVETYATNVMGTVNLLEAVRRSPSVKTVINVTSDKCYENKERERGYREGEPMGGFDPYSSSKGCAELVTAAYRNSFNLSGIATVRAGNVIGGGDWAPARLIPDMVRAILNQSPLTIRYPQATRPWQHVLDCLHGYLVLAEQLHQQGKLFEGAWNFGPNDQESRSVEWIVQRLLKHWQTPLTYQTPAHQEPHEATYLRLDCSKAKTELGWKPKLALDTTLEWVAHWYKAYAEGKRDLRQMTLDQINTFQTL